MAEFKPLESSYLSDFLSKCSMDNIHFCPSYHQHQREPTRVICQSFCTWISSIGEHIMRILHFQTFKSYFDQQLWDLTLLYALECVKVASLWTYRISETFSTTMKSLPMLLSKSLPFKPRGRSSPDTQVSDMAEVYPRLGLITSLARRKTSLLGMKPHFPEEIHISSSGRRWRRQMCWRF